MDSILNSVKKSLGVVPENEDFDTELILHINSVFSTLNQLGIGPDEGFAIEDDSATWGQFLGSTLQLNNAKSYMTLNVKLLFDQTQTSYVITSMKELSKELEWRMNVVRETTEWVNPDPPSQPVEYDVVLDGGSS